MLWCLPSRLLPVRMPVRDATLDLCVVLIWRINSKMQPSITAVASSRIHRLKLHKQSEEIVVFNPDT